MSDLLIFTTAAGRYRVYADLFLFCCKRAYPQYDVEILGIEENKTYWMSGEFKAKHSSDTLSLVGDEEAPALVELHGNEREHTSACLRFVFDADEKYSQRHKYCYITDIDMMICPESPSLLDFHLMEIKRTGLPYSNVPRWKEPMGENRMTGLHFVTKDWWSITRDARYNEAGRLSRGEIGSLKCEDELMLMRIIKASGLPVTDRSHLVSRHHGIHLGTLRDQRQKTIQSRRNAIKSRVSVEKACYWLNLIETPEYRGIFREIIKRDLQAVWELKELEKHCRQIAGRP